MSKSIQDVLRDVNAVLLASWGASASYGLAYNHIASAVTDLNFSGVPVINLKLAAEPSYVLNLVKE